MDNSPDMLTWMLIMACVGSGMMGGLFSAFSSFMMKAMSSLPDAEGIRAMQAINRFIVRPGFLFVFLGTGVLCLATAVMGFNIAGIAAPAMAATALYLLACIVSTIVFNIPLNNQLDAADP